jgi:hypothetical protein
MNNPRIGTLMAVAVAMAGCGVVANDPAGTSTAVGALDSPQPRGPAPRLLAPLSATISTSRRPVFSWVGADDSPDGHARVDICSDRACAARIVSVTGYGSAQPAEDLPPGVNYWRVTTLGSSHATSLVWQLVIPALDSGRVGSWGAVPDFNGDGFADLEVTTLGSRGNDVRIFLGGPSGPATTPSQVFTGPGVFGFASGPVGDVNGDGFCDFAVWTTAFNPPNTITIFLGGDSGVSQSVTVPTPDTEFGSQVQIVPAGDVNGDGYADLLVGGDPFAQLFLGGPTGIQPTAALNLFSLQRNAELVIGGADFNGDGFPDAIVSSTSNGGQIYFGDGTTLVAGGAFQISFGALAGDFNGDGFADIANGAVQTGGPTGPVNPFEGIAGERFYQGVGDVNGDGFSDVLSHVSSLVGVPERERAYFGGTVPCTSTSCPTFVPILPPGIVQGQSVAFGSGGVGDVNGDGFDDVAYFIPGAGSVFLFFGSPAGPPSTPSLTIAGEQGFGFSVGHL